jgi:hypothetical protein
MVNLWEFNLWLALWMLGLGLIVWGQRRGTTGVGLTLAYGLQMFVIHFLASAIYALPWYITPSPVILDGLKQSVYAIISFGIGATVLAPSFIDRIRQPAASDEVILADSWLVHSYLFLGIAAYIVQPVLRSIPTVGALVSVTSNLLLVALAMECWNGVSGPHKTIWRWVLLSAVLPMITIVTQGFLGYGFSAMLTVFTFVATIYRPRWRVIAFAVAISYLAMSVYVTYMRDRTMIREVVWGQESYRVRMSRMVETFSNFEFLDIENQDHLLRIDDRLNQNALVGASVEYLAVRPEEFAHGETIRDALLSPIPRALWPDKPIAAGSGDLVSRFTGIRFAEGTSVGIGNVMEWYVNFGTIGVVLGSILLGIVIAVVDAFGLAHLRAGNWSNFALWYLPALSLLQVGGSLVEAVSGAGAGLVMGLLIHYYRPARLRTPSNAPHREIAGAGLAVPRR